MTTLTDHNQVPIAVVGMACWYPGARDLKQLWENILARRREFRRIPDCRLPLAEYQDPAGEDPDKIYIDRAAVIDGFQFDWVGRRIPKTAYEASDIVHWLALTVALNALDASGLARNSIPADRAGVVLGNTLTGEYTRSTFYLRTRWPVVRRALTASARARGLPGKLVDELAATMERYYRSIFDPANEDSLPGNMSNTIAGRICNVLDFHGGGYTVDGACSSSLISIATAARHLLSGELDLALAGGVDVSLDTFELVGFSRLGAITQKEMQVYDRRASGFLPGEGCGMVVLKRLEDARRDGNYVYAVLNGWGISSDGRGGITAPNKTGQALAIQRAYAHAGYSPRELAFIEGHGTGTPVGDPVELEAIAENLNAGTEPEPRSCGITSVKSLIGHTKAAAGVAGFIKTVMAVNRRVLPPTAGIRDPNPLFGSVARALYPILEGEVRQPGETLRAGVQAMGFGGINCHMTLESADPPAEKLRPELEERSLLASNQQTEVFVLSADTVPALLARVNAVRAEAAGISYGEMVDLAAQLARESSVTAPFRAAVVADIPSGLVEQLTKLERVLQESPPAEGDVYAGVLRDVWASNAARKLRLGFLFPGQGSQKLNMGRVLRERHAWAREQVRQADEWLNTIGAPPVGERVFRALDRVAPEQVEKWNRELVRTELAQPAICLASVLWFRFLTERLGIQPTAVAGHSLGELTAFHAAGAFGDKALLQLAAVRGQAMAAKSGAAGAMAGLACPVDKAERILGLGKGYAVVANINSPNQTVISGEPAAVAAAVRQAETEGIRCRRLAVSNAFHTRLVADAADILREKAPVPGELVPTGIKIFSGMSAQPVPPGINLRDHFADQVLARVDFLNVVRAMANECDLFLEVGPGRVLSGLANDILETDKGARDKGVEGPSAPTLEPSALMCLPVEPEPGRDRDFSFALAGLFACGVPVRWEALYENRLVRPYLPPAKRVFIDNPCERPFRVSEKEVGDPITGFGGQLESLIAEAASVTPEKVSEYVAQRGRFLAEVAKADMLVTPLAGPSPAAPGKDPGSSPPPAGEEGAGAGGEGTRSASEILLNLVEKRTGFPRSTLNLEMRLLDDLNLDSIKAAELIAQAAKQMKVAGRIDTLRSANATLAQIAEALEKLRASGSTTEADAGPARPTWVRNFGIEFVPAPLADPSPETLRAEWSGGRAVVLHEPAEQDAADALRIALAELGAETECLTYAEARERKVSGRTDFTHIISLLPRQADPAAELLSVVERLQASVPAARSAPAGPVHVAYVQFGDGDFGGAHSSLSPEGKDARVAAINQCCTAAFAATLCLEQPDTRVRALDFPPDVAPALLAGRVAAELAAGPGYAAVGFGPGLERRVPRVKAQEPTAYASRGLAWTGEDVVLFTGGAKGIGAECALELARKTGVRLALVGSSPLSEDPESEVNKNLERFRAEGLSAAYYQCNITDPEAVKLLIKDVREQVGPITGVVHGAAVNIPRSLDRCSAQEACEEISPKLTGAVNLCGALADAPPKLFIGITSVIGITGAPRNGWYGFSNEALGLILDRFRTEHPQTQVQTIAYSVWSEAGMGVRLGTVRNIAAMGLGAITNREGVERFVRLFEAAPGARDVIVTGPLGRYAEASWPADVLPAREGLRFLEEVQTAEPGVAVTARATLRLEQDQYLKDHNYKGSYLFPTVFGLEAMAQAVTFVTGQRDFSHVRIENIQLERPIVVDPDKGLRIEIWAEVQEREAPGAPLKVKAAIGTESTGFTTDHFSATLVFPSPLSLERERDGVRVTGEPASRVQVPINPKRDLYGRYLFQGPMFQRIEQIDSLDSKKIAFRAAYDLPLASKVFPSPLGGEGQGEGKSPHSDISVHPCSSVVPFLLGDPFFLDALLQAPQLLMPQDVALPVSIGSIEYFVPDTPLAGPLRAAATADEHREQDISCTVTAYNDTGDAVLRLNAYAARRLESRPENPTAEELASPGERDERLLREELGRHCTALGLEPPTLVLQYIPGIHDLKKEERRKLEQPVFRRAVELLAGGSPSSVPSPQWGEGRGEGIAWLPSGKPVLSGSNADNIGVSDSHDEDIYIVVAGGGPMGCDLAAITPRSREDWVALLGNEQEPLLQQLLASGDSLDVAGTRIWSARETIRKAMDSTEFSVGFERREGSSVLFYGMAGGLRMGVLTNPVLLSLGPERMVAITLPLPH